MNPQQRLTDPFYYAGNDVGCLLIHGFTGAPGEMTFLGERLAAQGFTVYGIRLSGHGTTPEAMVKTRWKDWARDVEAGVEQLRQVCRTVIPIGLSMGGLLALHLATQGKADGVVALNAPMKLMNRRTRYALFYRLFYPLMKKPGFQSPDDRFVYDAVPTASLQSLNRAMKEVRRKLGEVTCPALVMQSTHDDTTAPESAEIIRRGLTAGPIQVLYWEKSGHILTLGPEREQVALKVADFVGRVSGAPGDKMG